DLDGPVVRDHRLLVVVKRDQHTCLVSVSHRQLICELTPPLLVDQALLDLDDPVVEGDGPRGIIETFVHFGLLCTNQYQQWHQLFSPTSDQSINCPEGLFIGCEVCDRSLPTGPRRGLEEFFDSRQVLASELERQYEKRSRIPPRFVVPLGSDLRLPGR